MQESEIAPGLQRRLVGHRNVHALFTDGEGNFSVNKTVEKLWTAYIHALPEKFNCYLFLNTQVHMLASNRVSRTGRPES